MLQAESLVSALDRVGVLCGAWIHFYMVRHLLKGKLGHSSTGDPALHTFPLTWLYPLPLYIYPNPSPPAQTTLHHVPCNCFWNRTVPEAAWGTCTEDKIQCSRSRNTATRIITSHFRAFSDFLFHNWIVERERQTNNSGPACRKMRVFKAYTHHCSTPGLPPAQKLLAEPHSEQELLPRRQPGPCANS